MILTPGRIFIYRVFDIGLDADLEKIQKNLLSEGLPQRFKLSKAARAMIINNAPLSLNVEGGKYQVLEFEFDYEVAAKIWHFGAISLSIQLLIPPQMAWQKLIDISCFLENDTKLHDLCVQKVRQLITQFNPARLVDIQWDVFEDYTLYFFKTLPGLESNALDIFQHYDVHRLILSENTETLSDQVKKGITESAIQYSQNDLAIINWNSALIIEPTSSLDIPDTIEFALCQLLEMRYYDDLLDNRLAFLYSELEKKSLSLWNNSSERLSKEAARRYIEISDTVESVENSLKVVGDFYLAQIFRTASARFRFNDWRESVDQKLSNLAEITKLLTSELNERRNLLLEIVIIVLISIELLPFLSRLLGWSLH